MSKYRTAIRFLFIAVLALPLSAFAANYDVKALIDTDNSRGTGCPVVLPDGSIVTGIDTILTTSVTVTGSTGSVTAVTRQTCVGGFFGGPVPVDNGWNAGVSPTGDLLIESHLGPNIVTMNNVGTPRFVFTTTSGLLFDTLLQPATTGGGDIIMRQAGRDHAVATRPLRIITLDGSGSDWAGDVPLALGTDNHPALRFISVDGYAGANDLYFNFQIHTNPAAPTAHDDVYDLATLGGTLSVSTLGVLTNDNPNGQSISAIKVDNPQHGTVALDANGGFVYSNDGAHVAQDQFHYFANGNLPSNIATVTISLAGTKYTFTSADHVIFTAGVPSSFAVTVTGKPTPALSEDGALPAGITFVDNGDGTATLSGTPGFGTTGTYPLVFHAEKNKPHQTDQPFTLTVVCGNVTSSITPNPAQVCANSTGNTASGPVGATTYAWSIVNGTITSATTIQTITYTAGASGSVGLTLTVTDASGCSATSTSNVPINPTPSATITPAPPQVCANSTGNTASGPAGMTTYVWSIANGTITSATTIQTITYTAGASGTVGLTLTVTNASGCSSPSNTVNVTINANPATPAITPTPASVCANSTGNTAAGPAGATTYLWSIANGTITSATNIQTITYTAGASGTVGLTLTVTNASGCSASNTVNVTINPSPATPTITPTPTQVCANSTGNTAAGPAGATTYAWSIVNGTITSATNIQTITYTAGASGVVGLSLTVTNASGCPASNNVNVTINANPATPTITPTPAQVCANSTGNSAAGPAGATTYAWSIVNGTITSATNIQTITYTAGASGTVGLTLVVTNASSCSATNTVNVTINANPAVPTITPTPASVCANSTGNSAAGPAGATTYAWSIANGTITSATNIQTITYTAGASGTVGLTLTVTNASGCPNSNTVNVTINPNPATPAITTPATVCAASTGNSAAGPAGATTYAWSITNGTITTATNIQTIAYTAGAAGTTGLTLTVTNASGCSATNTANVTVNPTPATPAITPTPAQVCANSTGNSAAGPAGATTYAWSIVNGSITSAINIQTITYTAGASGTVGLTLVVTNASACSASNTVNVTINANPAAPAITPTPAQVCANSTGNSAAGPAGATTYAWSIVNGSITSATNIQTITYTAGASGTVGLTLTVTNASGCPASSTVNVTINPNPATPTITTPNPVCANSTGNSAAGPAGATTYAWSIVNGTITSATNIQTITYTAGSAGTTDLTLTVTNASGCSATNTVNVTVNPTPATPTITPTPAQVCANSTGNSAAGPAGATTYAWSIVNGTITSATNIQTITYTAGASGVVGLTLTVTNASACPASNSINVTINANPSTPTISPSPATVCANSIGNSASGPAGATTYAWSIVNGSITSATNIQTITYTAGASGTVGLTLVVTNAAGCSASNNVNVTINPNPSTPTITPTPAQVCANSTGNSAAGPAGATTYAWSIVNGSITSATNIQTITYTAGASGTVGLTLTVTNAGGCPASNTVNVTINANPSTPTITPTPATVCANSIGNSAAGPAGATTYAWSIVNGSITSATNIQTITYSAGASGTVGLTLVVTNAAGCSASNTVNVTISPNPSTPTITPTPAQVCANSTGNSAAGPAGATTYAWSIVNGSITSATNIQTITYSAGASGTVDLTLVVTNAGGCSASNTVNVTINPSPATPTITPAPAQVCASSTGNSAAGPAGATTYAWSIVNGSITSATNIQTITYTAGASGTVGLTLIVTNAGGCPASNTVNVTINANPATPTITPTPAQVCASSTGNSAAGPAGATTYAWSIVNGSITSATNIQTITYSAGASGTVGLTLTVTNASGCSASNTVNVTINANPTTPTITPTPAALCPSSTGNSAAGPAGATTYFWSITNGTITSATNIQTITYSAGASGNVGLTLLVTNAAGCSASNSVNVPISGVAPAVTTQPATQSVQSGNSVTFTAAASGTPAPTVQWEVSTDGGNVWNPIGGATTTSLTFTAQLSQNGNQYRAVFTNNCGTATSNAATLTVTCPPIAVTRNPSGAFPNGVFNAAYAGQSVIATGGSGSYTYAIASGGLPTGLSLSSGGAITGTATATGSFTFTVTATDTANNCTGTSASLSIAIAPAANNDTYGAAFNIIDNTQFVVTGGSTGSPATPFVGNGTLNILTNDTSDAAKTATPGTFVTTGGGSVTIAADGTFIYTPGVHAAAITSDTFTYTVVSNGVASAPATVSLTLANRVWYVSNIGGPGNGQSQSPVPFLSVAASNSTAGDIIYVYFGDGTTGNGGTSNQRVGITLKNNQQLIGEGVALVVNTVTLKAAGSNPLISNINANGDVVTLADGNTVKGLTITGATRDGIAGASHAGFTGDQLIISSNTGSGLHFTSMTGTVTLADAGITGNAVGLDVNNGGAAITIDPTVAITANAGQRSVAIQNRPVAAGAITIWAAITDNGTGILVNNNLSGTIAFTVAQTLNTTTNTAVSLTTNTGATINFSGTLNVTTTTGVPFQASGGGTLNVSNTANLTSGAAANALSLNGITVGGSGVTFNSLNSTGATTAVALTNVTGLVSISGGTITNGAATTGVSLLGGSTSLALSNTTITGGSGATVGITNTTNFGTLTLTNANVSAATGISLTGGTLAGTGNVVSATGQGLILNTVVITAGTTFNGVDSSGGADGISLTSVSGTTLTISGGTLANNTAAGFFISGGNSNITFGGGITSAGASFLVDITGRSGGTVTFSSGTLGGTLATNGGTGIRIQSSTGTSTFTFSGTQTLGSSGSRMANTAVTLAGNATGTIFNFSGTMSIFTSGVTAFTTTTGGTINFSGTDSIDATTGAALVLNGVAVSGTLGTVNAAGAANGISLTTVTGSLTISAGALAGGAGAPFLVAGGTVSVTDGGTISQATASQPAVSIGGGHGTGTITFNGNLTASNGTGLVLDNADGTYNISGASNSFSGGAGMNISNGSSGTLTVNSGTAITNGLVGANTACFTVNGSTPTVTYSGNITKNAAIAGALIDITNQASGTITFQTGSLSSTSSSGTGINLSNVDGTVNFSGTAATLSGGNNGIDIVAGSGGTFSFNGSTSISNPSGTAFNVNTSSPAITYAGTITQNTAGQKAIDIAVLTGTNTITFSGAIGSNGGAGVAIACTGGTPTVTISGAMTLNNSASVFFATGSGLTINLTNANNTVGATNAATTTGVNITNATIGSGNVKFLSVSVNGGSKGIILNTTGSTGTFSVTGTGTTAGSGGTIQNTTNRGIELISANDISLKNMNLTNAATANGDNTTVNCGATSSSGGNANCSAAIHLSTVDTITIDNVNINGSVQNGINGLNVIDLKIQGGSTVQNCGNESGESGVFIQNLSGLNCALTNSTFSGNEAWQFAFMNWNAVTLGTLANPFNVSGCTFIGKGNTSTLNSDGILGETRNSGGAYINVTGSTFKSNYSYGAILYAIDTSNSTYNITGNFFGTLGTTSSYNNSGASVVLGGTATLNYTISTNQIYGSAFGTPGNGTPILVTTAISNPGASIIGTINGNTIGSVGTGSSGCTGNCNGITLLANGGGNMVFKSTVTSNQIHEVSAFGIEYLGGTTAGAVTGTLHIKSNTIDNPAGGSSAGQAILIEAAVSGVGGAVSTLCADVGFGGANSLAGSWDVGNGDFIRLLSQRGSVFTIGGMPGSGTATASNNSATPDINPYIASVNGGAATTSSSTGSGGGTFLKNSSAACP